MINIQGIPTPKPKIKPTITALPIVSPSRSMLKFPDRTASNKTKATIVDKISVNADSKLKEYLVEYVGTKLDNEEVTVNMIAEVLAADFPEFAFAYAEENFIRGYIDDILYFDYSKNSESFNDWPYDNPFFLIINLAIGGQWGGIQGIDNSIFPASFVIDYVRLYIKE